MPEVHAPDDIDGSEPGHAHGVAGMAGGEAACSAIPGNNNSKRHAVVVLGQLVGAPVTLCCLGKS